MEFDHLARGSFAVLAAQADSLRRRCERDVPRVVGFVADPRVEQQRAERSVREERAAIVVIVIRSAVVDPHHFESRRVDDGGAARARLGIAAMQQAPEGGSRPSMATTMREDQVPTSSSESRGTALFVRHCRERQPQAR